MSTVGEQAGSASSDASNARKPVSYSDMAAKNRMDAQAAFGRAIAVHDKLPPQLLPKHAVMFFENVFKKESTAQQQKGDCIACGLSISSTGSYKFHTHVMACPLMPQVVKKAFTAIRDKTESQRAAKRQLEALGEEERQLAADVHDKKQTVLKQQCIKAGMKSAAVQAADLAISEFFYANAIPFSAASAEPDSLYRRMIKAIQAAPDSYVAPTKNKLGTELLDECYNNMWDRKMATERAASACSPRATKRRSSASVMLSS
ncbi:hypothetical protein AB1Y20_019291 [Prymnesium parvum]|uniref:Uncharacterized protein n=1 Tax=Prymnesium parvum TaxID=97485 RepID=A0AB34JTW3_PRYPA